MKRKAEAPDLFANAPTTTNTPKLLPKLPATPQEEAQLRVELWETAPKHVRGTIRGENCIYLDASWQPIHKLTAADLVAAFSIQ